MFGGSPLGGMGGSVEPSRRQQIKQVDTVTNVHDEPDRVVLWRTGSR